MYPDKTPDTDIAPADVKEEPTIHVDGNRTFTMRLTVAVVLAGVIFTVATGWQSYLTDAQATRDRFRSLETRADAIDQRWATVFAKVDRMDERLEWIMKSVERQERRLTTRE